MIAAISSTVVSMLVLLCGINVLSIANGKKFSESNDWFNLLGSSLLGSLYKIALNPGPYTLLASVNKQTGSSGSKGYNTLSGSHKYFLVSSNAAVCCCVQNSGLLNDLIALYSGAALLWSFYSIELI